MAAATAPWLRRSCNNGELLGIITRESRSTEPCSNMPLVIDDSVAQYVTVKLYPHRLALPTKCPSPPPPPHPVQRVRDGSLEWFIAEYEGKEKIKVTNSGSGNFDAFKV